MVHCDTAVDYTLMIIFCHGVRKMTWQICSLTVSDDVARSFLWFSPHVDIILALCHSCSQRSRADKGASNNILLFGNCTVVSSCCSWLAVQCWSWTTGATSNNLAWALACMAVSATVKPITTNKTFNSSMCAASSLHWCYLFITYSKLYNHSLSIWSYLRLDSKKHINVATHNNDSGWIVPVCFIKMLMKCY